MNWNYHFPVAFLLVVLLTLFFSNNVLSQVDLELKKTVSPSQVSAGDVVVFTLTVVNDGNQQATGVEIMDVLSSDLIYQSNSTATGNYDNISGLWTGFSVNANDSTTLTITTIVDENFEGAVINNDAEVFALDQADTDSTPNNGEETEDDYAIACVSVPIQICDNTIDISIDDTFGFYQWYESGIAIAGANTNAYTITSPGSYIVVVDDGILGECGNQLCCPIVVIDDIDPPTISCPANVTIECIDDLEDPFSSLQELLNSGGTAADNCGIQSFSLLSETIE